MQPGLDARTASTEAETPSLTMQAQSVLFSCEQFDDGVAQIRSKLLSASVADYFGRLLASRGLATSEVVQRAGLDKDFGRQLLKGSRTGRRDYYIQLAIGLQLSVEETQSLLSFLGTGPLYALRKRDAAIMYALKEGFSLMDTQLLLDQHGLTPLGDAEDEPVTSSGEAEGPAIRTTDMEQQLRQVRNFDALSVGMNDAFISDSVNSYFSRLLEAKGFSRKQLIDLAGLTDKANLAFQLLNGTRTARNRDLYLRLALAMQLSLEETQSLLKFLKKGTLYPLKERDAALIFCLKRGYNISQTQQLLAANGLQPL